MQKSLFYFIALFVLFSACTPQQPEAGESSAASSPTANTSVAPEIPPPTETPPPNYKKVPQAAKEDLVYPKRFVNEGIPQLEKTTVANNIMLDNDQGKFGQRIKLTGTGTHKSALDFYTNALEKSGWIKDVEMDKTVKEEDVEFFTTNYVKNDYTFLLAITGTSEGMLFIDQILKEN